MKKGILKNESEILYLDSILKLYPNLNKNGKGQLHYFLHHSRN